MAARDAELETLEQERMVYKCYAGTVSGVLNPEGTISLCEVQWEIGNIRDFGWSFKKAWFSEKADAMRGRIANRECWCTHSCFMSSSLPFSVKGSRNSPRPPFCPPASPPRFPCPDKIKGRACARPFGDWPVITHRASETKSSVRVAHDHLALDALDP